MSYLVEQLNRMFPAEVSCIGCGQLGRYTSIGCLLIAQCCPQLPKAAQMAICSNNCKNSCAKGKQLKNLASFYPLHALRYLKMSNSVEWTRFHLSSSWKGKSERPLINSQWTTPKRPKRNILDIYFLTLKIFETYNIALRPSMNSSLDLLYLAGHIGRCSNDI